MAPHDLTASIAWQFPAAVWQRGIVLYHERVVGALEHDPAEHVWSAKVQGSAAFPYAVWVWFEPAERRARAEGVTPIDIDGDCDCPAPKPCKHLAALALTVLLEHGGGGPMATPEGSPEGSREAFTAWAQGLASASASPTAANEAPVAIPQPQLVLVVATVRESGRQRRVALVPHVRMPLPSQRERASLYDLDAVLGLPAAMRPLWLRDVELALWVRLQAATRQRSVAGGRLLPHDAIGARLLADAVAAGVCRLDAHHGQPLRSGPGRPARLVWRLDANAHQQLHIEPMEDAAPPWRVLPLAPLHYVDPLSGECGPIELELPVTEQIRLLEVPGVDPTWSGALSRTLRDALREAGIPLPRALAIGKVRRGHASPVLRLFATGFASGPQKPAAALSFDYEGTEVSAEDGRTTVMRIDGDRVDRLTRDTDTEQTALQRLRALGMIGLSSALTLVESSGWYGLAGITADTLRDLGWHVEVADDFTWTTTQVDSWYAQGRDESDGDSWFLELGVVIDGQRVNILPAVVAAIRGSAVSRERLRVGGQPLVVELPDGRRIEVESSRLQAIVDVLVELHDDKSLHEGALRLAKLDTLRVDALPGFDWTLDPKLRRFADHLRRGPNPTPDLPTGLTATLRDYQLRGVGWLQWLRDGQLGGILADDMGLGKTIEALAHILLEKQHGRLRRPALVVAPKSVLRNWQREAERFTPELRTAIYHGAERADVVDTFASLDLVITTYALLQRDPVLAQTSWHLAILDEAQQIKNPRAKVAIAARALVAEQRLCMTGTPVENNLGDLWSLMTFANPGLLGSSRQFTSWYRTPIERNGELTRFDALCVRIAPFMLRRTKAEVLGELPPKTEIVLNAVLEGPQRDLYESVRLTMEKRVRDELVRRGLARSRIVVLDALLKLRQVCCDPQLLKLGRTGRTPDSAKLALLLELVESLVAEGRRALVFSQFTTMLATIQRELDARRIGWLTITGKTHARQEIVDRFQAGGVPILLVSLKAGGTGLNLTAADTVIHYDPWWNPAVEAQATDRAHRIGQTKPLTVYRLICEGTVEERMLGLQAKKARLVRGVHDSAERRSGAGMSLEADEIAALLAPIGQAEPARVVRSR